ncbi:MAG: HDOD domain-containing protein, partial [Desulfobacteraceae bacterium]|nr:HDOD domain-containing protein [Desulfobacteraceae bacterium]
TYMALQEILDKGKKIMMNFSQKGIMNNLPYALPPNRAVVKITNLDTLDDSLIDVIQQLKNDGYQIAVSWSMDYKKNKPVFDMGDILIFDVSDIDEVKIAGLLNDNEKNDAELFATNVDSGKRFEICKKVDFQLYQGSFFKQPENLSVKKLSSNAASRFQILEKIEQEEPDFDEVAKVVQSDVAISFKLMSYLNSAAFGFRQKIESIKDAITMLGWRNMKNWLRVALLSDIAESKQASELIFLSVQRGKFLEQVIIDHDFWGFKSESLFLLGMFSLLDAMLNQPMNEIVKYLPLSGKIKKALCGDKNNEYYPLLTLAKCFEEARWEEGRQLVSQLGLDPEKVEKALHQAIEWANKLEGAQTK